ncbi:hypothetical protein ACC735_40070, partial [Rhizobium ruizarguesonis]
SPDPKDRPDIDFDARGHLDAQSLKSLNLPRDCDVYVCGPSSFMSDLTLGLAAGGHRRTSAEHLGVDAIRRDTQGSK